MILRRIALALLALAFAAGAQAQSWRPGFAPGFRSGFQFVGRSTALPAAVPLPTVSAAPLALYHVKTAGSAYTGPALRVARVSDGAQANIPFTDGRVDLAAARAFAGTPTLAHGVLTAVTSYDTTGGGNPITWTTGTAAVPFVSERDAYGPAFPDRAVVAVASQKYAFTGVSQVQRSGSIPTTLSLNATNVALFSVLAPMQSQQRNALATIGATTGLNRVTLYVEGSTGTFGFGSLGTTLGASADTKAPNSMLPRVGAQVMSVIARPLTGKILQVEDRAFTSGNAEDSRTITGGGIGMTGGGNTYFLDADFFGLALYPSTISDAEAAQVRAALAATFDTARRSTAVFVVGSSTPEGTGATNNRSYPRLMVGMLNRSIDLWNGALFGQQLSDSQSNAASRVWPALAGYSLPILWIDGGANDFLGGQTDTQVYATAKNYITAFKQQFPAGKVVLVSPTGSTKATTQQDNYRLSYIAMTKAGKTDLGYDAYFDRAAIPQAQVLTDTTYFRQETDGSFIHANDNLQLLYAQGAAPVLQGLLP